VKVSDYIIQKLSEAGVIHFFGYTGARAILLIDAVYKNPHTQFVNTVHEQTASFAVCAYAQLTRTPGVAIYTSGPGGTNMLTGIANAYCDSIPVVFLTGQAQRSELRGDRRIRNNSVQEVNIVEMARPVTKYAVCIMDEASVRFEVEKALFLAMEGRPGPVLIDLPEDLQRKDYDPDVYEGFSPPAAADLLDPRALENALKVLEGAIRPVIILGNGAHSVKKEIGKLATRSGIPVVCSMSAIDVCDNTLPNYLGPIGNYGLRCANFAVANSDAILTLGCSMTKRYTGANLAAFAPGAA
jgi:acetolactate synthase-1/2/3 large subunit